MFVLRALDTVAYAHLHRCATPSSPSRCSAASHTYLRPASSFYPSTACFVRCHLDVMTPPRPQACLCSIHVLFVDLHSRVTIYRTSLRAVGARARHPPLPVPSLRHNQATPSTFGACSNPSSARTPCASASASSPTSVSSPAPPRCAPGRDDEQGGTQQHTRQVRPRC